MLSLVEGLVVYGLFLHISEPQTPLQGADVDRAVSVIREGAWVVVMPGAVRLIVIYELAGC